MCCSSPLRDRLSSRRRRPAPCGCLCSRSWCVDGSRSGYAHPLSGTSQQSPWLGGVFFARHHAETDYGKYANVDIHKIGAAQFSVSISGLPTAYVNDNTQNDNNYTPNSIQMGMELCGTSGAYAPRNGFTNNQYLDAHSNQWFYQSLPGVSYSDRWQQGDVPSQGFWTNRPNGANNHGGLWTTCTDVNC